MTGTINSEARLSTFEAICMIVGNSIGTGIIAVPYLATKNSMLDVIWMVAIAYYWQDEKGVQLDNVYSIWIGYYDRREWQYKWWGADICELV